MSNDATPDKPINAKVMHFPGLAGITGLTTALGAVLATLANGADFATIPNPVQVGILGVIGAGLLAAAIAAAGDALARAYVVANTVETTKPDADVKPALHVAGAAVAGALGKLTAATAQTSAHASPGVVPLAVPLELCIDGTETYRAIAARSDGNGLEYLAAPPGERLRWHKESEVRRSTVAPAAVPSEVVALPHPIPITWRNQDMTAILVKIEEGLPKHFYAGAPGEDFEWRPAGGVRVRQQAAPQA